MTIWTISLVVETVLLILLALRARQWPVFTTLLIIDIASGAVLLFMADRASYDVVWRILQIGRLIPRTWAVMEAYKRLTATRIYWRVTDFSVVPVAGCGALIFRVAQYQPLRWPWSSLEQVYCSLATMHCFLAFILIAVLAARHRRPLRYTEAFWHAVALALYFGATCLCYYSVARYPELGTVLMWIAAAFYAGRLLIAIIWLPTVDRVAPHLIRGNVA